MTNFNFEKGSPAEAALPVVRAVLRDLKKAGYELRGVDDGEGFIRTLTEDFALEVIMDLEVSTALFRKDGNRFSIVLIPENGSYVICDHTAELHFSKIIDAALLSFKL